MTRSTCGSALHRLTRLGATCTCAVLVLGLVSPGQTRGVSTIIIVSTEDSTRA